MNKKQNTGTTQRNNNIISENKVEMNNTTQECLTDLQKSKTEEQK